MANTSNSKNSIANYAVNFVVSHKWAIFFYNVIFGLLFSFGAQAQLDNTAFEDRLRVDSSSARTIQVGFTSFSFLRNNEYFNNIADGYTLFGNQLLPRVSWFPTANIRIDAGLYLWKDFGNPNFTRAEPTFTFKYRKDSLQFLFGNLEGNLSHRMVEPMFNFEKVINDRLEQGFQIIYENKYFRTDTWVDWLKMQYPGSKFQEQIYAGTSSALKLYTGTSFRLSVPFAATLQHRGGQIDSLRLPTETVYNGSAGIVATWQFQEGSFVKKIEPSAYALAYKLVSGVYEPYTAGNGTYLNALISTKAIDIMASYWQGNGFIAKRGGLLYQSVGNAIFAPVNYKEDQRSLLFIRVMKNIKLANNITLVTRIEPYYNFKNNSWEYSYGVYITYKGDFKVAKY